MLFEVDQPEMQSYKRNRLPGGNVVATQENGFTTIADVSQREAVAPELWQREDGRSPCSLSRLVLAEVRPAPR